MKKTELLIPVGNMECLIAAIHNGADAVYLGGKKFGARAYSNNFDEEELIKAIELCHLYGVKIYVTVNTMIYNEEVEEVLNYLNFLYIHNVDAVIMQDIGLINLTRKQIPNLEIHVSTQAHNHNKDGIEYYKKLGCQRVVFDRESPLESILNIDVNIEKEVFVYGALCICYSGNCLFSALNGGRSANRGMCVGSCRLPYKLLKNNKETASGYLLSTKDLNTIPYLKELLDNNIDSLKVEGRMKSKEYVSIVTKTYRKLIDNYYNNKPMILTDEEIKNLLKVYNRGFTKGYLFNEDNIINSKSSNHQGVYIGKVVKVNNQKITIKLEDDLYQDDAIRFENTNTGMYVNTLYNDKGLLVNHVSKNNLCFIDNKDRLMVKDLLNSRILKTIDSKLTKELNTIIPKKIPINISFKAHLNTKITLNINDNINNIEITGNYPEQALNAPITKDSIIKQLSKLGDTPFILNNINIDIDNNLFINIKDINELRRIATEKLINLRKNKPLNKNILNLKQPIKYPSNNKKISILVRNESQLIIALKNNIDYIYVTNKELYTKYKNNKNIYLRLNRVNLNLTEYHNERLLCTELGSISKYNKDNIIRSDYYLNIANDYSIKTLENLNCQGITLSVESSISNLNNIANKKNTEIIIYGNLECMIIKNNIFNIQNEKTYLVDTKNNKYPVIYEDNFTHILNHNKINLIDNLPKLNGFSTYRLELFDEDEAKIQSIINKVKDVL